MYSPTGQSSRSKYRSVYKTPVNKTISGNSLSSLLDWETAKVELAVFCLVNIFCVASLSSSLQAKYITEFHNPFHHPHIHFIDLVPSYRLLPIPLYVAWSLRSWLCVQLAPWRCRSGGLSFPLPAHVTTGRATGPRQTRSQISLRRACRCAAVFKPSLFR